VEQLTHLSFSIFYHTPIVCEGKTFPGSVDYFRSVISVFKCNIFIIFVCLAGTNRSGSTLFYCFRSLVGVGFLAVVTTPFVDRWTCRQRRQRFVLDCCLH
jgi:hypothetical protein